MSSYNVTPAMLKSQANDLSDLNARFKTAVEQLVSSELSLNSMWKGEANDAFHNAFNTDKSKMDEFYNLINIYVEKLTAISTRYAQSEQTNTQIATNRNS